MIGTEKRCLFPFLTILAVFVLAACSSGTTPQAGTTVAPGSTDMNVAAARDNDPSDVASRTMTSTDTILSFAETQETSTPSPTHSPEIVHIDYQPAFGIDYAHPEKYLEQGEQSHISNPGLLDSLRSDEQSIAHLGKVFRWLKREFSVYSAGGRTIGVVTVDQLLMERKLGGCHDHGLVYAAVVRELGYPAVMVRTVSISWVERFQAGEKGLHVGHVFVEVYLDGKWVLIDSTGGWYLEEGYNPADPVIPLKGPIAGSSDEIYGFYVERKGIDTWTFGIHSPTESTEAMDEFAQQLNLEAITYPEYQFSKYKK